VVFRLCCLIIFAIPLSVYSQYYTKLFEDLIPREITKNAKYIEMTETNFETYADIHPDLVYYYIEYLNSFLAKKINKPALNYFNILAHYRKKYETEKQDWLTKQKEEIELKVENRFKREKITSYIANFQKPSEPYSITPPDLPINENLKNYVCYAILSQSDTLSYNAGEDYQSKINKKAAFDNLKFNESIKNLEGDDDTDRSKAAIQIVRKWYLFSEATLERFGSKPGYDLHNLLESMYDKIETKNLTKIFINVSGILPALQQLPKTDKLIFTGDKTYDLNSEIVYYAIAKVGFGAHIRLKDEKLPFSFIEITGAYILFQDPKVKDKEFNIRLGQTTRILGQSYVEVQNYILGEIKSGSSYGISLDFNTPVAYFTDNISFDLGIELAHFEYKSYVTFLHESYRVKYGVRQDYKAVTDKRTVTQNKFLVMPKFSFNYSPLKELDARLSLAANRYDVFFELALKMKMISF